MKFTCTKENLLYGLQAVASVAGKQIHLPILNNILIIAENGNLKIVGTNLELAIVAKVRGVVEIDGSFTLPARTIVEYVSLLPNESHVECELLENELQIKAGRQRTKMKGMPANDFPVVPVSERKNELVFSSSGLKRGLHRVLLAVSHSETRPELQGVLVQIDAPDQLRAVFAATDSYRLSEVKVDLLKPAPQALRVILPGRTIHELQRLLPNTDDSVSLAFSDGQCACFVGDVEIISRLTDGSYPDYRPIVPKEWNTEILIPVSETEKIIKAASLFAAQGVNAVLIKAEPEKEFFSVSSTSSQFGEHSSDVATEIKGQENTITLNHRFLLDGISAVDEDRAFLRIVNGESPCFIAPEKRDDFIYIVMPIRQ